MQYESEYGDMAALIMGTLMEPVFNRIISEAVNDGFLLLSERLLNHLFLLNEQDFIFGDARKEEWEPYIGTYVYIIFGNGKCPKNEEDILKLTPSTNSGLDVYRIKDALKDAAYSLRDFQNSVTSSIQSYQLNDFAVAAILAVKNKTSIQDLSKLLSEALEKANF